MRMESCVTIWGSFTENSNPSRCFPFSIHDFTMNSFGTL